MIRMCHSAAKLIPYQLILNKKYLRIIICEADMKASSDSTFMSRIIIGDENWIDGCDL